MMTFQHYMKRMITLLLATFLPLAMTAQELRLGNPAALTTDTIGVDSVARLPWERRVQGQLDSLIAESELLKTSQLGLMVWDLTADSAVYVSNHRQRMRPASTMKLLTAITAIDQLGGSHQFRTEVRCRGSLRSQADGSLRSQGAEESRGQAGGSLRSQGAEESRGQVDGSLRSQGAEESRGQVDGSLRSQGVKELRSQADGSLRSQGAEESRGQDNSFRGNQDDRPHLTLMGDLVCVGGMDPAFDSGDMKVLVDRIRQAGIDTICGRVVADKSFKDTLLLGQGWCWDDDNPCLSALLVNRKDNFAERLQRELEAVGVVFLRSQGAGESRSPLGPQGRSFERSESGEGNSKANTDSQRTLASVTHSLDQILTRMMKQSDNLYAECVFYHAALSEAGGAGRVATAKNARAAVKREIQRTGLDPARYNVADGSGLSLYNYVSAELLTMMLRHAWRSDRISQHLLPSLPVAGVDGTLKDRMKQSAAYRNVRAKTGTLTGISSLAGYCTAGNGHQLCFAIINQGVEKAKSGKAFQDKVCALLCAAQ